MTTSQATILAVDDDPSIRTLLRMSLADAGFEVRVAANGSEALDSLADDGPVDVIVLDLNMPVMDGPTFFRELRARGDRTPVLMLSAYGAVAAATALNADAAIEKPFDIEHLAARLLRLAGRA